MMPDINAAFHSAIHSGIHTSTQPMLNDPHAGIPPLLAGAPLSSTTYALVLVHGRGGSAESMVPLAKSAGALDGAIIAPRAADGSWYPDRFMAPVERNEPWLTSALASVDSAVKSAVASGVPLKRIVIAGFSQGACLSLEYVARNPARYGGVAALAGALIGADVPARTLEAALADTPVLLACGDQDAHIPEARVRSAASAFNAAGAEVDVRLYEGLGHTVIEDQIDALRAIIDRVRETGAAAQR